MALLQLLHLQTARNQLAYAPHLSLLMWAATSTISEDEARVETLGTSALNTEQYCHDLNSSGVYNLCWYNYKHSEQL